MRFIDKIDILVDYYGVKKRSLYEEMGMSQPTFIKSYKNDFFSEAHKEKVLDKWGVLIDRYKVKKG